MNENDNDDNDDDDDDDDDVGGWMDRWINKNARFGGFLHLNTG